MLIVKLNIVDLDLVFVIEKYILNIYKIITNLKLSNSKDKITISKFQILNPEELN